MADGGSGVKQFAGEMGQAASDVAKDIKDEVGQMVEQGVQSVVGPKLTPKQLQQKELERQKKMAEARRKIKWWQDIAAAQKAVREKEKQKELQRQQQTQQQQQIKQFTIEQKKRQPLPEEVRARSMVERKTGRGVGG